MGNLPRAPRAVQAWPGRERLSDLAADGGHAFAARGRMDRVDPAPRRDVAVGVDPGLHLPARSSTPPGGEGADRDVAEALQHYSASQQAGLPAAGRETTMPGRPPPWSARQRMSLLPVSS